MRKVDTVIRSENLERENPGHLTYSILGKNITNGPFGKAKPDSEDILGGI